ncbi:hypothetical protein D9611_008253 [Ephemerocybe angulata]|uniref:Vacuolar membrane-associated protein IML1 n=1 Tax=Ephemerocybe angulata TaxID=980116 RepID=A0A8H5BIU1_9AGAR|nr:hypothetical protein D9611_008253 [Tulosesus angulatus]
MANSRAESVHSQYSRRRSNTAQSIARIPPPPPPPPPPLIVGSSKVLNAWVHEIKDSPNVIINHAHWPGVVEGDLLRMTTADEREGFLFFVPRDEGRRVQLQISIPRPIADALDIRMNDEMLVTKVEKEANSADHVEFVFQDQYLGRNDMWRLGDFLTGQCVYANQEVTFIGSIAAKIHKIWIGGKPVSSAVVTPSTKAIYRSLSAKVTIFIQVCKELWEFSGDGERYYEKIVHSFLPDLFAKWRKAGTNHTVHIVLISRVFYEESEVDYAAGPLRRDERGNWYKDFYKVITDLEVNHEWKPTLVALKNSFWDFQRDILLTHHYHRASLDNKVGIPVHVRLVGQLSCAQDGPILEALNLGLNPTETHYIDRSLSLTGSTSILITPGTGYFRVSKQLLRLTTTRMLDQGVVLNLVLLTKQPLHQSPIFSFQGVEPGSKSESDDPLMHDALWCEDNGVDPSLKKTFWWEPFWLSTTFWDKQKDLPFRQDRFIARAKMHEIQMLGLLEHDVLASIEVPFLPEKPLAPLAPFDKDLKLTKEEAQKFDNDIFVDKSTKPPSHGIHTPSIIGPLAPFSRSEKRNSHRNSLAAVRIPTIEEQSPRRIIRDLPDEGPRSAALAPPAPPHLSTSPSQSSIHSVQSERSIASEKLASIKNSTAAKAPSVTSKFTPSWLRSPFSRSGISEPQASQVSASGTPATITPPQLHNVQPAPVPVSAPTPPAPVNIPLAPSAPIKMPMPTPRAGMAPQAIKGTPGNRSNLRYDEDTLTAPSRASFPRRSPINTPPRDDYMASKRRSGVPMSALAQSFPSSSPGSYSNPSNPSQTQGPVSYLQSSMSRRWQHILPQALKKHDIKWSALITPGCLPLTVDYFPSNAELESCYDISSWDIYVDPREMKSFLVRPPQMKGTSDELRGAFALVVMRGMAAVRLAQGFQFVIKPQSKDHHTDSPPQRVPLRRTTSFISTEETVLPRAVGASDILKNTDDPVFLSMTNEIHKISFNGEMIQVKRYVRRLGHNPPFKYQCLIWPKLGVGYTELSSKFESHGFENYHLDMLVAGYEHHLHDSLRYWRTRFIVIPTAEPPVLSVGPSGESLNEEEIRIIGIEKLVEQFSKLRWQPPDERLTHPMPPVRFLPTTLDPAMSVLDDSLIEQLDQIHAMGPMRKKAKSDKDIADLTLSQIVKLMREEPDGVPIKHYLWHRTTYANSFIGADLVNWILREFRDVSSRAQATEWGVKLFEQGLFEHCRGEHGFLDGHYYYRFKGEYAMPVTTNVKGWFTKNAFEPKGGSYYPSNIARPRPVVRKKRLILSQTMVIDLDPNKRSDQAECVLLHHDIIHNPATVFHFELQWIGTTARCIEDQLKQWNRTIDMYGLKLVEAYVMQISDIRERNAFQSCYPIRFAVPPPIVPDLEKRVQPETRAAKYYFEYALLHKFGFIVDVEAQDLYSEQVDVFYSYRRSPFHYSQFVHRSGVAFIQVLDGGQGFLFLTNRLIGPGRMGATLKTKGNKPAATAEEMRQAMAAFCMDPKLMNAFYDEQLALLPQAVDLDREPPFVSPMITDVPFL